MLRPTVYEEPVNNVEDLINKNITVFERDEFSDPAVRILKSHLLSLGIPEWTDVAKSTVGVEECYQDIYELYHVSSYIINHHAYNESFDSYSENDTLIDDNCYVSYVKVCGERKLKI